MHISEGPKLLISKTGKIIIIALLGFLLIGNATNGYNVARANSSLQHEPNRVELQASDDATTYLPVVLNNSSSTKLWRRNRMESLRPDQKSR
jgi:hypothetical protein